MSEPCSGKRKDKTRLQEKSRNCAGTSMHGHVLILVQGKSKWFKILQVNSECCAHLEEDMAILGLNDEFFLVLKHFRKCAMMQF